MNFVVFGLTISSSRGTGHATLWRGLAGALARRGHHVTFFERDLPYYAAHRDLAAIPDGKLELYTDWSAPRFHALRAFADADVAIVTSFCPDGVAASELVLASRAHKVFYDLDTPVTLDALAHGAALSYIGPAALAGFDLVLSFTGGAVLNTLKERLGARQVAPLYRSVDPEAHHPVAPQPHYRSDLSYVGTYAEDRQAVLQQLFFDPAGALPQYRSLIAGAQHPAEFPWLENVLNLYADAMPCLNALSGRSLGIISNGGGAKQRAKLRATEIEQFFSFITISEDVRIAKPAPGIFVDACRRAGKKPEECVYVGDSPDEDALPSRAAGLCGFRFRRDHATNDLLTLGSLAQLALRLRERIAA